MHKNVGKRSQFCTRLVTFSHQNFIPIYPNNRGYNLFQGQKFVGKSSRVQFKHSILDHLTTFTHQKMFLTNNYHLFSFSQQIMSRIHTKSY